MKGTGMIRFLENSGAVFGRIKQEGEAGGDLLLPLPFQNLDAALDEEFIRVDLVSYYADVATDGESRQSPPEMILRVIFHPLLFLSKNHYNFILTRIIASRNSCNSKAVAHGAAVNG
jgi:hypothetical protein